MIGADGQAKRLDSDWCFYGVLTVDQVPLVCVCVFVLSGDGEEEGFFCCLCCYFYRKGIYGKGWKGFERRLLKGNGVKGVIVYHGARVLVVKGS